MNFFETQIIDSQDYGKYKKIRIALMFFIVIYATFSRSFKEESWEVNLHNPLFFCYLAGAAILIGANLFAYYKISEIKTLGELCIDTKGIHLKTKQGNTHIPFSDIQKLYLARGSTYHKKDPVDEPLRGDNWIEIVQLNKVNQKYEFQIYNAHHNEVFENSISHLHRILQHRLDYKSI